jgi:ABC-type phosphate transport system ATPase subunit
MNKGEILEQSSSNTFFKKPKTDEAIRYIKGEILL